MKRHRRRGVAARGLWVACALVLAGCGATGPTAGPSPSPTPASAMAAAPMPTPGPTRSPSPTPQPTSTPDPLVASLYTGLPVTPSVAARPPIAVMIDDHPDARPQSGLSLASIVWQAPAEGGIPRYLAIFADQDAASLGPVRSARPYFIAWAAEWRALYVHVGASTEAASMLLTYGNGSYVVDADEYRWGGPAGYLWRTTDRAAPHNVYSSTPKLLALAARLGAKPATSGAWTFGPPGPLSGRPVGATISLQYPTTSVGYTYDRLSNTWLRSEGGVPSVDHLNRRRIAPTNVVVLTVQFGLLNDGSGKGRLEANMIGSGPALVATGGLIRQATWEKASVTAPTLLFDASGNPVTLTAGQTFVEVVEPSMPLVAQGGSMPPGGGPGLPQ